MGDKKQKQFGLKMILAIFLLSSTMIIVTTPLHEAAHWVMSDIDPYVEPVELHLFDDSSFKYGDHILSSALGYVRIEESYPGAFKDRPAWADMLQELICIAIQLVITCFFVSKMIKILFDKKPKVNSSLKLTV